MSLSNNTARSYNIGIRLRPPQNQIDSKMSITSQQSQSQTGEKRGNEEETGEQMQTLDEALTLEEWNNLSLDALKRKSHEYKLPTKGRYLIFPSTTW